MKLGSFFISTISPVKQIRNLINKTKNNIPKNLYDMVRLSHMRGIMT